MFSETMTAAQAVSMYIPPGTWQVNNTLYMQDLANAKAAVAQCVFPRSATSLSISQVEETVESYDYDDDACDCACDCEDCSEQEEENTMYSNANVQVTEIHASPEKDYLRTEGQKTYWEMDAALEKKFGLTQDERPMTATELVARIQSGKFILDERYKDERTYNAGDYITWRDPAVKEDKDGYKAAEKLLKNAYRTAKDVIEVKTPAEGLDALIAFRSTTIQ